jgi:hypothetical protein
MEAGKAAGVGTLLKFGADGPLHPTARAIGDLREAMLYLGAGCCDR